MPRSTLTVMLLAGRLSTRATMLVLMIPPSGWGSLERGQAGQVELLQPLLAVGLLEAALGQGAHLHLEAVGDEDGRAVLAVGGQRVLVVELLRGVLELVG